MTGQSQVVSPDECHQLAQFVFLEAQLADESRWEEWEALLADDMHYWVPINETDDASGLDPSIINDNRSRLGTRLRQLRTGTRHSQAPKSVMRRMLSNMTFSRRDGGQFQVTANFVVYEYQNQSTMQLNVWPGRVEYRLRPAGESFKIVRKKVNLVHASGNVPTLSFII
ncbi:MAG: aromatic-ring-hydroxylating dioxygenase subunit beta [Xanthobacteraceae bacterium]|nr:aromatic-ring-hydroxylating dioxygenase subunit beta [Xanthobacteraceae bacterium]